ncbi:MAG: hypothetical protein A3E78_05950 [Alphaproteobacteria bacterium RIFCSPHIGHO2_12_FULL_63_12]|nr:MAG: hypothetical protein A3E78_05950 [Alphaproteobacteria bacterium RIFCSPHIGHO2_12_FULL_63_12]
MRVVLLVVGWFLSLGAVLNALFAVIALWFIAQGQFAEPLLSVEALFRDHVPFMMWTKSAAAAILPAHLAEFFFAAPALVIFPLRAAVAGALGYLALKAAARMSQSASR